MRASCRRHSTACNCLEGSLRSRSVIARPGRLRQLLLSTGAFAAVHHVTDSRKRIPYNRIEPRYNMDCSRAVAVPCAKRLTCTALPVAFMSPLRRPDTPFPKDYCAIHTYLPLPRSAAVVNKSFPWFIDTIISSSSYYIKRNICPFSVLHQVQ